LFELYPVLAQSTWVGTSYGGVLSSFCSLPPAFLFKVIDVGVEYDEPALPELPVTSICTNIY
jgi:hypothetical protein